MFANEGDRFLGKSKAFNMHEILLLSSVDIFLCILFFTRVNGICLCYFFQFNEFLFVQVLPGLDK